MSAASQIPAGAMYSVAQYADYESKLNYVMYRYFLAHAKKRVAG